MEFWKCTMESLTPKKIIRLSKSCLSGSEKQAVLKVLDHEFLGMGEEVNEFEKQLTKFFSRPAITVINGTSALHLALQSIGVRYGDEVLVPSLTYIASFQAISATGAKPIACDINPDTLCLDIKDAKKRLTSKTKAIMPVHYAGRTGNLNEIYSFAIENELRVVEDAAHSFGTEFNKRKVGSFGDIACFSFDGIKNITSGEGGCIVSDDKEVISKIQDARLLGVVRDTEKRYSGERSWEFDVLNQGWRFHMSNIMASIGIEQLKRFDYLSKKRIKLANFYDDRLKDNKNLKILDNNQNNLVVPHIYVVQLNNKAQRSVIRETLSKKGIQTGIHYQPNHLLSYFKDKSSYKFPVFDSIYPRLLTLPLHPDLNEDDISFVCDQLIKVINNPSI
jgi:dTDP-4-amino-4,6-dideoxygalactose transaminase